MLEVDVIRFNSFELYQKSFSGNPYIENIAQSFCNFLLLPDFNFSKFCLNFMRSINCKRKATYTSKGCINTLLKVP